TTRRTCGFTRGKWGIWVPHGNRSAFQSLVEPRKKITLSAEIDFGTANPGDESIRLLINGGEEIARLNEVRITGITSWKSFIARGGDYLLTEPKIDSDRGEEGLSKSEAEELFTKTIRPLFAEKCGGCHGQNADRFKGAFDMRSRESILRGGESGERALVPGKPEESFLYLSLTWKDPEFEMPPKENDRLSSEQLDAVRQWIVAGAPWVEHAGSPPSPPDLTTRLGEWTALPGIGKVRVSTSPAQSQIWAERGYDPDSLWSYRNREAVIPPTTLPHPIDGFVRERLRSASIEPGPRAEPRLLNRRLSYSLTGLPPTAEQVGTDFEELLDQLLASPHYGERIAQHWLDVTRYADSNGFSRDEKRPDAHRYRTYVIDSFNADKPFDRFVKEQIAGDELGLAGQEALGFLWMGPWEFTNMTSAAVARQMWLDDVVNSIGVTFLGHELSCAKCHDHKFDPIPTRDYYAMQAIFAGTQHHLNAGKYEIRPRALGTVSILKGGSLESPTEAVAPAVMSAFDLSNHYPIPSNGEGRRAALANWIADPAHPLTARVIANRVWQWHFGEGLVATPNGFGVVGAKPTHPRLLDFLANYLVENDWSIKALTRLILTSDTWQRSTTHPNLEELRQVDPNGELLATFPPRRLTAEEIRDSMLMVSGELNRRVGGASFRAQINWEVAFQPRLAMGKLVAPWEPDRNRADRNRRTIYAERVRNLGHPMLEVLNRPNSDLSCEARDETTVVTQAFTLFHGDFSNSRALAIADRLIREKPETIEEQIDAVFALVLGRSPSPAELKRCRDHIEQMRNHHRAHLPKEHDLPREIELSNVIERTGETATTVFKLKQLSSGYERDLQAWEVGPETRALAELCLVLLNSSEFLHVY
ncbi:MAG: PSD1 and planctomycete cytochrome C domain-containing protein, partial [Verrucomicrobiota bacterium]